MSGKSVSGYIQFMQEELKPLYPVYEIRQFSRLIFSFLMNFSSTDILLKGDAILSDSQVKYLNNCIERLKSHEPIQYILGQTEFLDLTLKVNPSTLIPRPETEELVVWVNSSIGSQHRSVLDIGTGSGCIALGVKSQNPELQVEAWDISNEALQSVTINAKLNSLVVKTNRVDILSFTPDSGYNGKYDIVVSNPPYVLNSEKELMEPNVLKYEPHQALFVEDSDPLIFYRKIINTSNTILKQGGLLFFEINETYGKDVKRLLSENGYSNIQLKCDLSGKDRMVRAMKKVSR